MNEQQEAKSTGIEAIAVVQVWALALQLPLRRRIGRNILGLHAVLAMVLTFFWAGLGASMPVAVWFCVYMMSVVAHRIATIRRRLKGEEPHTYYDGRPWLAGPFRGKAEFRAKVFVEPIFAFVLAVVSAPFGESSVLFFLGGAVCMVVDTLWTDLRYRKRVDDMHDAMIDAKLYQPTRRRRW